MDANMSMYPSRSNGKARWAALASAVALSLIAASAQAAQIEERKISQSDERKNMKRVGHTDLQGRPAYMPDIISYPNGKYYAFVGMHSGSPVSVPACPQYLPNPLKGNACENNGTMIIDVSDPKKPVEKYLIPSPAGGQTQSQRMCWGSKLPDGTSGKVYMLRNVQGGASSGYEMWDVTNVEAPTLVSALRNLRSTHKPYWECSSGIAYLPGSKDAVLSPPPAALWRQAQSLMIVDWGNPSAPGKYIRTVGLPGSQPGATGAVPSALHGAISAFEHPQAMQKLARTDDVIGNRIYSAWGVGDDGVLTTHDRKKLLPAAYGGTWVPAKPDSADAPTEAELIGPASATVTYYLMSPDQGGHTAMPVFGLNPPSFAKFNEFGTRDVVLLSSEATSDGVNGRCNEAPHFSFIVDVTVENSMSAPPGTRVQHDMYHGPWNLSTMSVDERSGANYWRGDYCGRGARFGVHSSEENFNNPMYGRLTTIAYFNGGVRLWDIREPQAPREVGFYVPYANSKTNPSGYMTNNVEIDNRGYVFIVDRNGAGLDILELTGCAKKIVESGVYCKDLENDNAE